MGVAKQALAPKQIPIINGFGSTPSVRAVEIAIGRSNTAVALLLKIWELMLVRISLLAMKIFLLAIIVV